MLVYDALRIPAMRMPRSPTPCLCPYRALLALPAREECVRTCRQFTEALIRRWGLPQDVQDSAVLVVDELTANAARHGHADMTLLLVLAPGVLIVSVADSGARVLHPSPQTGIDPDEHGRGTEIVEFLAEWTAVRHTAQGHNVRVGLSVPMAATPAELPRSASFGDGRPARTRYTVVSRSSVSSGSR